MRWLQKYASDLQFGTLLSLIFFTALHRGGISIQAHLFVLIVLFPLFIFSSFQKEKPILKKSLLFLICGLGFLTIISYFFSTAKSYGFFGVTEIITGLSILFIASQQTLEPTKIKRWLEYLILLTTGLAIFGIILYVGTYPDRLFATFGEFPQLFTTYPNAFALFLIAILPFSLWFLFESPEKKTWSILNIILTTAFVLTFSRGSWLSAITIGVITIILLRKKITKKHFQLIGIILIGVTLLVTAIQKIREQNFSLNTLSQKITLNTGEKWASVDDRIAFWKGSLEAIKERPLWGSGPDTFPFIYTQYQKNFLAISGHPHNIFLKIAVENGIPTTIFILTLFIFIVKKGWYARKKEYIIPLLMGIGAIILHNVLDYNLNFTNNNILLWTFLGWILSLTAEDKKKKSRKTIVIGITCFLAIFLLGLYEIKERIKIVQGRGLITNQQVEKGLARFENTNPIFRQELDFIMAERYKSIDLEKGEKFLEEVIKKNPAHVGFQNLAAEILIKKGEYKKALEYIKNAIHKDPKNWLRYYHNELILKKKMNLLVTSQERKKLLTLLRNYYHLLRVNAHNTVMTDNPHYAVRITALLEDETLRKKLTFVGQIERKKFFQKFQIPLPVF